MMVYIPFGEWKPDETTIGADSLKQAYQIYANGSTYLPLRKMIPASEAMEGTALGSASFIDRNGNIVTVAGDETSLYISRGTQWENISREQGYNGVGQVWRFAMWGDYILATNFNDPIQAWKIGSAEKFADMSESAPRCKDMAIVSEFLVLVNTVDTLDGERPNRIWWSPIGNPFGEWVSSSATLCDYQDIQVGSYCVGVVGGAYGVVMMRDAIIRMTFVGSPIAFTIETMETDRGAVGLEAFCADGSDIYFAAQDGFYRFNGSSSVSLSAGRLDRWFFDNVEQTSGNLIISSFDIVKKVAMFGYPEKGEYYKPTKMLLYGAIGNRWSEADCDFAHFSQFLSKGYTLEELDYISETVEELPFPMDSNYYKGGIPSVAGLTTDGIMYMESDEVLPGTIATGEIVISGRNTDIVYTQRVLPIVEGGENHTMSISSKQILSEDTEYGRDCALTRLGDFSERKSGRYHSFRFNFGGNWSGAKGFEVIFTTGDSQ